jgi:BolA protein
MEVQQNIQAKLQEAFEPQHLEVINESHLHSVPAFSETHFKVVLVSDQFVGKRSVARHQQVYGVLKGQFEAGLHALALHTYTAEEWQAAGQIAPESTQCGGGSKAG